MSSKSSKNGTYNMLVVQKDVIKKITGIITPKSIDTLENESGTDSGNPTNSKGLL